MSTQYPTAPKISDLNPADPMFEGLSVEDYDELFFQVQMITEFMRALNPMDTAEARIRWFLDLVEYCYTHTLCMLRLPPLRRAIQIYFETFFIELAVENPAASISLSLRDQLNRMYGRILETNLHFVKDSRYRV
jgi:hypothetical protein